MQSFPLPPLTWPWRVVTKFPLSSADRKKWSRSRTVTLLLKNRKCLIPRLTWPLTSLSPPLSPKREFAIPRSPNPSVPFCPNNVLCEKQTRRIPHNPFELLNLSTYQKHRSKGIFNFSALQRHVRFRMCERKNEMKPSFSTFKNKSSMLVWKAEWRVKAPTQITY